MRIFALSLLLVLALSTVGQEPSDPSLPNFHKLNAHLFRGGQPGDDGFAALKQMGIKTVIDLRDDDERASREKALVEKSGMRFVNVPLGNWSRPDIKDIDAILKEIDNTSDQPIFVHCKRGKDRTGTVMAIYRMTHDDWTAKQAGDEAEKYGIGWWQFGMRDFINDYYRGHIKK